MGICERHSIDPAKTLIVDDNATSWFGADRETTNFWMPPCYGYQIHDIDNELQLLCKYLWDPVQQNHLRKKALSAKLEQQKQEQQLLRAKVYEEEQAKLKPPMLVTAKHAGQLSQHSSCASSGTDEIVSKQSPKSVVSSNGGMGQRFLHSPNSTPKRESLGGSLSFHQSVSYSTASNQSAVTEVLSHDARNSVKMDSDVMELMEDEQVAIAQAKVTSMSRISRGYNKRKYKEMPSPQILYHCNSEHQSQRDSLSVSSQN